MAMKSWGEVSGLRECIIKIRMLPRSGKIRIAVLTAVLLFLLYLSVGYSFEIASSVRTVSGSNTDPEYVDGTDFSVIISLVWAFFSVFSPFFGVFYAVFCTVFVFVASLVLFGAFRLTAFRRGVVTEDEFLISKKIHKYLCIAGFTVSVLLVVSVSPSLILAVLLLHFPVFLFGRIFCTGHMKKILSESDREGTPVQKIIK